MSSDYQNKGFKELLDKLQQESWQLELIISGFAIFGLFTALPELKLALDIAKNEEQTYYIPIVVLGLTSCAILLFNLLIHVVLRGLWIGALGLRYVSGDIDFDSLKYSDKFTRFLKKRIVSFDKYVATLENYCSILFAISFLLIFYVISLAAILLSIVGVAMLIIEGKLFGPGVSDVIGAILILFIIFGSFLVFLDFLTQGFLKKKKWLSKIYFPFYWVFSFITLSFLYRPLVYNFLDNRFTKRLSFFLVPIYILILTLVSFKYKNSNYLESIKRNSNIYVDHQEYEDQLIEEDDFVKRASIQSQVISEPYVKLFRVFNESIEDRIYRYNSGLKPKEDQRGFETTIVTFNSGNRSYRRIDSLSKKYVETFNKVHKVYIDTIAFPSDFMLSKNGKNQTGFETFLSIKDLKEGKHLLRLKRIRIRKSDTSYINDVTIPFWYFKNN